MINKIKNYTIVFLITWIGTHLFYYVRYSAIRNNSIKELIVMGFTENIVFYTIIIHLSLILITLSILYRYAQNIITRAKDDADKIKSQALGKAAEIESDLLNQSEKLKQERIILEEEYQRKNLAKSLELEAVRKKMIRLKKNQYDPRRQKKST